MKTCRILIPIDRLKRFTKSSYKKNDLIVAFAYNNLLSSCLRVGMYRRMGSFSGVLFSRYRLSNAFQRFPTLSNGAQQNCKKVGGNLAKITSAVENQFMYDLLKKQRKITTNGAWLELRRKADTKFYWMGRYVV